MAWPEESIATMRCVSRRTGEYVGPCPFCRAGADRYHIWTKAAGQRPAWRYWCRVCGATGVLTDESLDRQHVPAPPTTKPPPLIPHASEQTAYRAVYRLVATWAQHWLFEAANPLPLAYLCSRGLTQADALRFGLGYALADPHALLDHLQQHAADLLPAAEAAGVISRDAAGQLRTHWTLCGTLVFPTLADGMVTDLRMRRVGPGQRGWSLPGSPRERGACFPNGWEWIGTATTVVLTESGECKTLVPVAAYLRGELATPTVGIPGMHGAPPQLGQALSARGVAAVVLAFDSQVHQGRAVVAPELRWSLALGHQLQQAGLQVRILRLPLLAGQAKIDLDAFLLQEGAARLQRLIDHAPPIEQVAQHLHRLPLDQHLRRMVQAILETV